MTNEKSAISPKRSENFPEWYQEVIAAADMAENSEVRGCMVIKPWGYAIWELMQAQLDKMFKDTGHKNAYFPLFIPLSYLEKEADHVAGFAKECAVVTHHRLEMNTDGKMIVAPAAKLTEPLVVRPTSETIITAAFARWVQSYRDLPILINQWCNVVRWELRPRIFLRSAEFLWQEGHTAHETKEEALAENKLMCEIYAKFATEHLALPVIMGHKTESERFAGAEDTLTIEAMVQDGKAIQAGTSHFLGQNFAKAAGIQYLSREGKKEYAWSTSWGVSTRMIGTVIMAHADDDGLVLPPRIAPAHVVIIPILAKEESRAAVLAACEKLASDLRAQNFAGDLLRVEIDSRDTGGGAKSWEWIKKGVPLRVEIGPRDLAAGTVFVARRDQAHKDKKSYAMAEFAALAPKLLAEIQQNIYDKALRFREAHTKVIESKDEFYAYFKSDDDKTVTGFALAHWAGDAALEEKLKADLKVTIRCIPLEDKGGPGKCLFTGKDSPRRVVFAKAY
jgi:prolyl-tRNA synthetase